MLAKIACATALGLSLLASGAARADGGGGGGGGSDRQSALAGTFMMPGQTAASKQQAGVLPDQELTDSSALIAGNASISFGRGSP
jgi:hypothetical protein